LWSLLGSAAGTDDVELRAAGLQIRQFAADARPVVLASSSQAPYYANAQAVLVPSQKPLSPQRAAELIEQFNVEFIVYRQKDNFLPSLADTLEHQPASVEPLAELEGNEGPKSRLWLLRAEAVLEYLQQTE
jgi:hypothetical protein